MFVLIIATLGLMLSIFIAILFKKKKAEIDKKLTLLEELE
jgi:glycopeptide antibiotics resistance protein